MMVDESGPQGQRQDRLARAMAEHGLGNIGAAIRGYRAILAACPGDVVALNGLGMALMAQGPAAVPEAERCFQQAAALRPDAFEPRFHLGMLQAGLGHWSAAAQWYRAAEPLARDPVRLARLYEHLAVVSLQLRAPAEAERHYREALRFAPDPRQRASLHGDLAALLHRQQRYAAAEDHYRQALAVEPHRPDVLGHLAMLQVACNRPHEAVESYQAALQVAAARGEPLAGLAVRHAMVLPIVPESATAIDFWWGRLEQEVAALAGSGLQIGDPLQEIDFAVGHPAHPGRDVAPVQAALARFFLGACPSLAVSAPHCPSGTRLSRMGALRVGVEAHALRALFLDRHYRGMVAGLARAGCEVVLFSTEPGEGPLAGLAVKTVVLHGSLADRHRQIAAETLDVLFYPVIADPLSYFLAFARLAPVQCVSWGALSTTGIPTVDYYLSDRHLDPPGAERDYSERLVRFDRLPIWSERPTEPVAEGGRQAFGFGVDWHLYVCVQSLFKLHPDFDSLVAEILRSDEKGWLILVDRQPNAQNSESWLARFRALAPEVVPRVRILHRLPFPEYRRLLACADVLLDSPHFSGGLTSLDALALGQAPVTLPGRFARSRQTATFCQHLGITDTVAADAKDYVRLALRLAGDPMWRASLRERILARHDRLFEDESVLEPLIGFFQAAVAAARDGRRLEHLPGVSVS